MYACTHTCPVTVAVRQTDARRQPQGATSEVAFVDRVRAVCALLGIGNAQEVVRDKPAALQHAVATIKNGSAFRWAPRPHSAVVCVACSAAACIILNAAPGLGTFKL
jgi:hypothetical protein